MWRRKEHSCQKTQVQTPRSSLQSLILSLPLALSGLLNSHLLLNNYCVPSSMPSTLYTLIHPYILRRQRDNKEVGMMVIPILQMRKLSPIEVEWLFQGNKCVVESRSWVLLWSECPLQNSCWNLIPSATVYGHGGQRINVMILGVG